MARVMILNTSCVCRYVFSLFSIPLPFSSILKKSSFWILVFVAFLVFSAAEGEDVSAVKKKKREMKLRNKAEIAPAEVVKRQSDINHKIDLH